MRKEKVEVAIKLVGSETSQNAVMLRNDRLKRCKPLLPSAGMRVPRRPGIKLLRSVERSSQRMNGRPIHRDDLFQVGPLVRTDVHSLIMASAVAAV